METRPHSMEIKKGQTPINAWPVLFCLVAGIGFEPMTFGL